MKKDRNEETVQKELIKVLRDAEEYVYSLARNVGKLRDTYEFPYMVKEIAKLKKAGKVKNITSTWVQRRFKLGYARTARLLDLLEEKGVVATVEDAEPRKVLVPRSKKYKILMVEDDVLMRDMYAWVFKEEGFAFYGLPNADGNFLEKVIQFMPDIISMDVIIGDFEAYKKDTSTKLCDRNGFQAVEILKAAPRTKNVPVIFLSNLTDDEHIKKGFELGAVDYLIPANLKPQELPMIYREYIDRPMHYKPRSSLFRKLRTAQQAADGIVD